MLRLELNLTHINSRTFLLYSFFIILIAPFFLWPSKTLADNPPPICYTFDNNLQGWTAGFLAGSVSWLPSKMHLDAEDHPSPANSDYYALATFPDDIPNVYKITFSYDMSRADLLFRLSNDQWPTELCSQDNIGTSGSMECNFSPSISVIGSQTTLWFDSFGAFADWSGNIDNVCIYSSTIGPPQTLYLPLIINQWPGVIHPFRVSPATSDLSY